MDTPSFIPSGPQATVSRAKWAVVAVVALVVVAGVGYQIASTKTSGKVAGVNTTYQAVFLTNGQVYFGKLTSAGDWVELTDIYYLQVTQPLQQTTTPDSTSTPNPQSNIQLVKLGSELHGPEDTMHIEKDKVLFWENMKDDSKVVQAIHQYKAK